MEQTVALLLAYKYLILLPLAVIEGPIVMVIAAFLVATGILDPLAVYLTIVFGDLIGDSILYGVGYWGGRKLLARRGRLSIAPERFERVREYFRDNHRKAVVASKLVHGLGITGLLSAGVLRIPYGLYIRTCFMVTLAQSAVFFAAGFFFGHAYLRISGYLDVFSATVSIAALVVLGAIVYKRVDFRALRSKI